MSGSDPPGGVRHRAAGLNAGAGVAFEVFGLRHYWTPDNFIVSSGCRWSSDLAEPHQPGGRDLQ